MVSDAPLPTRRLLLGIWGHLSRRRRLQFGLLLVVMFASGVAELLSLGAVLPFMAVLNDPQLLWQHPIVQNFAIWLDFTTVNQLLLPATLMFAAAAVFAAFVRLLNLWLNGRLAAAVGSDLSCETYRRTLYQPYAVHVQRTSSVVITATTTQIDLTVVALNNFLKLITSVLVAFSLLVGLLLIDAPVALGAAALFGTAYGALAITARRQLRTNGQMIATASTQQIKALQEDWEQFAMFFSKAVSPPICRSIDKLITFNVNFKPKIFFLLLFLVMPLKPWGSSVLPCLEGCW